MHPKYLQPKFWILIGILLILGATGAVMLFTTTPLGLGLGNDSVAYIAGARSLLAGNGYSRIWLYDQKPITHFPPFFSLVLAIIGFTGIDPLTGANGLVIFLYALNTILVGLCAWEIAQVWQESQPGVWAILASVLL